MLDPKTESYLFVRRAHFQVLMIILTMCERLTIQDRKVACFLPVMMVNFIFGIWMQKNWFRSTRYLMNTLKAWGRSPSRLSRENCQRRKIKNPPRPTNDKNKVEVEEKSPKKKIKRDQRFKILESKSIHPFHIIWNCLRVVVAPQLWLAVNPETWSLLPTLIIHSRC